MLEDEDEDKGRNNLHLKHDSRDTGTIQRFSEFQNSLIGDINEK
jgi:hypothetical protein